jgi:pyrroline-5-carboxylate reductase
MFTGKKITFLGAGNMAEALISGMIKGKLVAPGQICATDIDPKRLKYLELKYKVKVDSDNQKAASMADIIVVAVKPQVLQDVLGGLKLPSKRNRLVISVVAGTTIDTLLGQLPKDTSVVRAMPNTPAMLSEGVTALASGPGVSSKEIEQTESIFLSVGKVVRVNESLMDTVTGLSGGGPAYVYMVIEALTDGGVKMGLPRPIAQLLSAQTVLGAAKVVLESGEHPGRLKDQVTSPGGTTIAGVHELEKGNLRAIFMNAVESATHRSQELGLQSQAKDLKGWRQTRKSESSVSVKR